MRRIRPSELPADALDRDVLARFCVEARRLGGERIGRIIVYGSMARGEAGPDSDLDIWVDWNGREAEGRHLLGDLAAALFVETGLMVGVHVVDPSHARRLEEMEAPFYRNVQREGLLVEG